ncbi:MAG TPA: hypothetical protein VN420_02075 [Candidatus Fimivivens sp.]|nr:hypothetical protein [Candidatus Fimivivens sp.]
MDKVKSLGLFPSGVGGYEEVYRSLRNRLGSYLLLPGEIIDFLGTCRLSYTTEQVLALARDVKLLERAVKNRPEGEIMIVVPGIPFLSESVKVYEYFEPIFNAGSEQWPEGYREQLRKFLSGRLNDRVGFPWLIFRVPYETYNLSTREQRLCRREYESVPNVAELLWVLGVYRLLRGCYPVKPGTSLRVETLTPYPTPLFEKEWKPGTALIDCHDGIRITDHAGKDGPRTGTPFIERVIRTH